MDREDHKTFIPGVGFLVTSWDGSESHIFPIDERTEEHGMNIERLLTLENAVAWESTKDSGDVESFFEKLLGINPTNMDWDATTNRAAMAFEELLNEADANENDGQPSHYEEMQDYFGGDDFPEQWDEGYDAGGDW